VPMLGNVAVPAAATPPTGSANAPSSGGGGSLQWIALLLLAGLVPLRRAERD
jgi:hypothetical protein